MTSHIFNRSFTLQRGVTHLYGSMTIGAAGAITAQTGLGITATRTGAGLYTLTLDTRYNTFLKVDFTSEHAVAEDLVWQVATVDLTTNVINVRAITGAVETDPSNGSVIRYRVTVGRSAVL